MINRARTLHSASSPRRRESTFFCSLSRLQKEKQHVDARNKSGHDDEVWILRSIHSAVMVGEGRPSTSFFFSSLPQKEETRGCSPSGEHDENRTAWLADALERY